MDAPLDELYFTWLYRQVGSTRTKNPARTHWVILRQLFTTEYVWWLPNDDNRAADGRDLRLEFLDHERIDETYPGWLEQECSFLEMMIALSRRLAQEMESRPAWWFWHLMNNLGLERLTDDQPIDEDEVDDILNAVNWRLYSYDGRGGLFPLQNPREDQRDVEIWYQLNAYLQERE